MKRAPQLSPFEAWALIAFLIATTCGIAIFSNQAGFYAGARDFASRTTLKAASAAILEDCHGTTEAVAQCAYERIKTADETVRAEMAVQAQVDATKAAVASSALALVAFGASALGLFYLRQTLLESIKSTKAVLATHEVDTEPFLTVEFLEEPGIAFRAPYFYRDGKRVQELWFRIHNTGRSPAIVTGLCRRWSCTDQQVPARPVDPNGPRQLDENRKVSNLPVGAGGHSGPIKAWVGMLHKVDCSKGIPFFDGYIQFETSNGRKFVTGFLIAFASGRFHHAWPPDKKNPKLYSYHTELSETDELGK